MSGDSLIQIFISATGLPQDVAERELRELIARSGKDINSISLEDLREILAEYLQDVLTGAKRNLLALDRN